MGRKIKAKTKSAPSAQWTHDCEKCVYHGSYGPVDVYTCGKGPMASLLVRYGNDGPEYTSSQVKMQGRQIFENLCISMIFAMQNAFGGLGKLFDGIDAVAAQKET